TWVRSIAAPSFISCRAVSACPRLESSEMFSHSHESDSYLGVLMLELRHLRSLLAIADTRTLADAAQRMHLTQSALSHQIRALEAHYGLSLFERTPRGLRFTPGGERLLALAGQLLPQVDDPQRDLLR